MVPTLKNVIAIASLLAAASTVNPISARADAADDAVVRAVQANGLASHFASPGVEISEARRVCTDLKMGSTPISIAFNLSRDHDMNKGQAQSFMNIAVDSYCPDVPRPQF